MTQFLRLCSALCLTLLLLPVSAAAGDLFGLPIRSIMHVDEDGAPWPEADSLLPLLMVKPGDRLDAETVREGITNLYLKRQFRDVRVEAYGENGGVALVVHLTPVTIVDKIVLRGNHSLSDRAIKDAMAGMVGRELREEQYPDIRMSIQALYQAEGFYGVRVNFRSEKASRPHAVHLYVYVIEPKRTVIEKVRFRGNTVFAEKELASAMQNRAGTPLLTNVLFEQDLPAIQRIYAEAGYPAAQPGPVSMSFKEERAFLDIGGSEGPKVTVSFGGNRVFSDRELGELLILRQEHDVSDTVIESSAEKIRNAYRDEGYADVKVETAKRTGSPAALHIHFAVTEGPRVIVETVRVEGNSSLGTTEILDIMETKGTRWYRRARPFREDLLEKDRDHVLDRYNAAGFLNAEVKIIVARSADGKTATITLKIVEGMKTLVGNISFEGNALFPREELASIVAVKSGMPYSDRMVEEDKYRLLTRYAAKGYLYARVDAEKRSVAGEGQTEVMDIQFRITEDKLVTVGTVILRGNAYTRDWVLMRELEPKKGEPYSYEKILQSQQRVYRYGYFSQARYEPIKPFERTYQKDMLFTVEERPAGAVEFGVGYGDLDRLRGFVELSHRNLWGTARYASLRLEGSDILKRAAATFQEPWFLGHRLQSHLTLAWSDRKNINQDTRDVNYQTRKTTAAYGIDKLYNGFKSSLTYQFENVDNYNVKPEAQLSFEDSGRVLISSLNPAVIWDLRDDPFNPTRGGIHGIVVKESMKELGSEAVFTKASVQSSWFFGLFGRSVLALSGRAGMAWAHQDTEVVPIHERFYLGGGTTIRGYTQDSVGPYIVDAAGERIPTGGSSMAQLNAEVRVNSTTGGGGIVLFTDGGNVWIDKKIRPDDLRASYGIGLRYNTPVGPLRVDYGQKIHRRSGETPGELHFNIGHAF
ncbi:MAG: outer membrane protein assembly factor BamA [Nitrospirota bacterium]|nr:outer membrane protein assembly factor BamA [Nitrospirota bacterium]